MYDSQNIKRIAKIFKRALDRKNLIKSINSAIIFYDLSFLENRLTQIKKSFPSGTLNTVAIKANPLVKNLQFFKRNGFGLEAASFPELYLAEKAGVHPSKIVFDSPAKTIEEITYALKLGVHINADSFDELERISFLRRKIKSKSTVGIRINPQVGTGKIKITSVAGEYSKFGIPIKQYRKDLQKAFLKFDWLTGVHLHIGSQGISADMLLKGIGIVYEFAEKTNALLAAKGLSNRIKIFDIGGGLPIRYKNSDSEVSVSVYAKKMKKNFPLLFSSKYKLITEFGRWINANVGWTVSRVEYVKKQRKINTAVIHVGADMFVRSVYNPGEWHHNISVLDSKGMIKSGNRKKYVIAGPLCFSGDKIATDVLLPEIEPGDFLVIHDTGAYTLSMWSRYNSRLIPKIIGYYNDGNRFSIIKKRETPANLYIFWS